MKADRGTCLEAAPIKKKPNLHTAQTPTCLYQPSIHNLIISFVLCCLGFVVFNMLSLLCALPQTILPCGHISIYYFYANLHLCSNQGCTVAFILNPTPGLSCFYCNLSNFKISHEHEDELRYKSHVQLRWHVGKMLSILALN
jgi:hypothetical protein